MSASRNVFSTLRICVYEQVEILLGAQLLSAARMVEASVGRALTSIENVLMTDEMMSGVLVVSG